jgi:hypothetical protein
MSINNISYDIIYFAAAVTWIQLGGNEQLFAFSPREAAVVQEGSRAVTHAAAQFRTIVTPRLHWVSWVTARSLLPGCVSEQL